MTVQQALEAAVARLENEPIGPPRMAAESLMMHVIGKDRALLYAHPEEQLSPELLKRFEDAVAQRAAGKPLQYITGHQEFFGLDFIVSPAVLIPRPETEHLVESALQIAREHGVKTMVDVGTGSGCIALALAHALPEVAITAVDISEAALAIARKNAERLGLTRIDIRQSDLLSIFHGQSAVFDMIVSNPPYVGRCEADKVQREVREHEPEIAVFGGDRGLDIYQRLLPQCWELLKPGGWLLLEIGYSIEAPVRELLNGWSELRTVADLQEIPRVVVARKG